MRLRVDSILYATAIPPASSDGELIRLPDDRADLDFFRNASLARLRLNDASVADELLFTTIGILYFLRDLLLFSGERRPCRHLSSLEWGRHPYMGLKLVNYCSSGFICYLSSKILLRMRLGPLSDLRISSKKSL